MGLLLAPIETTRNGTFLAYGKINGFAVVAEESSEQLARLSRSAAINERLHKIAKAANVRRMVIESEALANFTKREYRNPYPLGSIDGLTYTAKIKKIMAERRDSL